ncbi:bacterioferritin [Photobacterium proteolyticum]|uniref:Bacterioferritin-associated ferredoxin n=1 Tax=Photobacterium proteolyticum TaxID=1903952 RepID=A0A1Q9GUR7_9GAMM|nr:(2Fe-2S)-binding protein [Photobacterium proteolyticum]OLQ78904.1 bacterioferritin [Photobacterium proteolyticum]
MYVCLCHGISDKKIMKLTQQHGITDVRGIRQITPLGSMCGKCIRTAKEVIEETVEATRLQEAS